MPLDLSKLVLETEQENLRIINDVYRVLALCNVPYWVLKLALILITPCKVGDVGPVL